MGQFEIKTEDGVNKLKNGSRCWTIPIVDNKGRFFKTSQIAAEALGTSPSEISKAISGGRDDIPIRNATRDEIKQNMAIENARVYRVQDDKLQVAGEDGKWVTVPLTEGQARRRGIRKLVAEEASTPTKPDAAPANPFAIVVWPDQVVTVRIRGNADFVMTRSKLDDVPEEIRRVANVTRMP